MLENVVVAKIEKQKQLEPRKRNPASLPMAEPGEKKEIYVIGMKPGWNKKSVDLLGITFEQYVLPPEASEMGNENQYFPPKYIAYEFTEKQVQALLKRAEEVDVVIPPYRDRKNGGKMTDTVVVPAKELIFIRRSVEFTVVSAPMIQEDVPAEEPDYTMAESRGEGADVSEEDLKKELYREQRKVKK